MGQFESAFGLDIDYAMLNKGTAQTQKARRVTARRRHRHPLRVTTAMEAGIADRVWSINEIIVALLERKPAAAV